MSTSPRETITSSIAALIETLDTLAPAHSDVPFLPAYLTFARTQAGELALTPDELAVSVTTEERQTIEDALDAYAKRLTAGYTFLTGCDAPDWLSRYHRTAAEYYAGIATGLAAEPEVAAELTPKTSMTLADFTVRQQDYQMLIAREAGRAAAASKVQRALDLQASLVGMLRLLGQTNFEIRQITAG